MAISLRKLFSFTSWSVNHPTEAVPGEKLDAEFAALRGAVETLSKQLDEIRRDDGKLKNELITTSTLDPKVVSVLTDQLRKRMTTDISAVESALANSASILEVVKDAAARADAAATLANQRATVLETSSGSVLQRIRNAEDAALTAARAAQEDRERVELVVNNSNYRVAGDGGEAEKWAYDSMHWAEYMDGNNTIPPNYLEHMAITGDHWSSRWWAHRSQELGQEAVDGIFKYYIGAYAVPPTECPNGDALTPGVLYYDTTSETMYVWDGDSWNPLYATVPTPADLSEFHYTAYAGQTDFGGVDMFGNTPNDLLSGNANVFLNGVRLTERLNWQALSSQVIRINRAATAGSVLTIEWFDTPQQYSTAGKVDTVPWMFDGSRTTFPIYVYGDLYSPVNAENMLVSIDGVMLDPGVDFTISGSDIIFCEAPLADARKWALCGLPIGVPDGGGPAPVVSGFAALSRYIYAATTAGQTQFYGVDKYGLTLSGMSDPINTVSVHVNGVLIETGSWTIINDGLLQLNRGVALSSTVTIDVISVAEGGIPAEHSHDAGEFV